MNLGADNFHLDITRIFSKLNNGTVKFLKVMYPQDRNIRSHDPKEKLVTDTILDMANMEDSFISGVRGPMFYEFMGNSTA